MPQTQQHNYQKLHALLAKGILFCTVLSLFGFYYTSDPLPLGAAEHTRQDMLSQTDTVYLGFGNEPGWRLLVTKAQQQLHYSLLLDYGEIKLKGTADEINSDDHPGIHWFVLKDGPDEVWVSVTKESCIDESDADHGTSIALSYGNRDYKGCGSYYH